MVEGVLSIRHGRRSLQQNFSDCINIEKIAIPSFQAWNTLCIRFVLEPILGHAEHARCLGKGMQS